MFEPNYQNIVDAARNKEAARLPLYEHNVSPEVIKEITGKDLPSLYEGDDMGYKCSTLLSPTDTKERILPEYKPIVDLVHSYNKPFLLHSCGKIFDVMDDLIEKVGIDAKHSNEDQIAAFPVWVEKYGDKIGNFGGIDVDVICNYSKPELKEYFLDIIEKCKNHGGIAVGTGNSIPAYVPADKYLNMIEIVREYRGDYR